MVGSPKYGPEGGLGRGAGVQDGGQQESQRPRKGSVSVQWHRVEAGGQKGRGEAQRPPASKLKGRGGWTVEVRVGVRPSGTQLPWLAGGSHIGTARKVSRV